MKQKQRFTSGSYRRVLIVSLLILLFPLIGLGNENETIISGSEMWDLPRVQTKNIRVNPGAILTITSMIYMDAGTKITIEPGGKLVVDGGTITTACLDPWLGIEVLGNSNLHQAPTSNQGWVKVINGGTISKALVGIRAGRLSNSGGGNNLEHTGGIVQIDSAVFSNNQTAIELFPYFGNNISYIRHSTFKTDTDLPEGIVPDYFIRLYYYTIQDISGCEFKNLRSGLPPVSPARGSGIYSWNSRIYNKCSSLLTPCPSTAYYPNKFYDLYRGIYALSGNPGTFISIIKNEFSNNYRGLYLSGVSNARVTSNEFVINTPFEENGGYGMYLDACTGYWVEDNKFQTSYFYRGLGLLINNSGNEPNEIYRNEFVLLKMGISVQGNNRSLRNGEGLQIRCNDFLACDNDLLIANPEQVTGWGIAAHQGADSPNPKHMAGNLFNIENPPPPWDFDDINNEGEHITYYYPINNLNSRVKPVDYTEETVTRYGVEVSQSWTHSLGCPDNLEEGGGSNEEELRQQMAENEFQIVVTQNLLDLLVDGGNTESLQWDVNMSTSPEAMQVYNELMDKSPWLSDTVVSTAILKENVLPGVMLRDIMVANPHTAKSVALMEKLDQRWTPLPDYMKAQILLGKSLVSIKEQTESKLMQYKLKKATALAKLAGLYHDNADSLIMLYGNDATPSSKYKLAFLLLGNGEATQGMAILNDIPAQFNLDGQMLAGHQQLCAYYEIFTVLHQQGEIIPQPDSLQLLLLAGIETQQAGLASVYARNFLLALKLVEYDEPILLPDLMKSRALTSKRQELMKAEAPGHLRVFPNPTRVYLIAEYELPSKEAALIEFTDAQGKVIHQLPLNQLQDQVLIDTRHWKTGWYVATLKLQAKTLESVKFLLTD